MLTAIKIFFFSLFDKDVMFHALKGASIAAAGAALVFLSDNLATMHLSSTQMVMAAALLSSLINIVQKAGKTTLGKMAGK